MPYGALSANHLRVDHAPQGGATGSHDWFAADPALRHVLVRCQGRYGVRAELVGLAWWA